MFPHHLLILSIEFRCRSNLEEIFHPIPHVTILFYQKRFSDHLVKIHHVS